MMTNSAVEQDAVHALVTVVRLLDRANELMQMRAEAEGRLSAWHMLAMGVDTAACQAVNLLPADVDLADEGPQPLATDPRQLLRAANTLLGTVPIEAFPAGTSQLVVSICDLVRETSP